MNTTPSPREATPQLKIVALEEHYITAAIRDANLALPPEKRDPSAALQKEGEIGDQLLDLGAHPAHG